MNKINNVMAQASIASLNDKKVFLLDMDGTIYNEGRLFTGVSEFLAYLRKKGIRYYFLTNNSSKSSRDYVDKLAKMGIVANESDIIISTHIAANYLKRRFGEQLIYVVGTKSMVNELTSRHVHVTEEVTPDVRAVLVGNDNELTFKKLTDASYLLTKGAAFIATNVDKACPVAFGYVPDCGSICTMLTQATGRRPRYMGKPQAEIVNYLHAQLGVLPHEIVMVGDRLYTDMLMAIKHQLTSVLVLSGEATLASAKKFKYHIDYIVKDIATLLAHMQGNI